MVTFNIGTFDLKELCDCPGGDCEECCRCEDVCPDYGALPESLFITLTPTDCGGCEVSGTVEAIWNESNEHWEFTDWDVDCLVVLHGYLECDGGTLQMHLGATINGTPFLGGVEAVIEDPSYDCTPPEWHFDTSNLTALGFPCTLEFTVSL